MIPMTNRTSERLYKSFIRWLLTPNAHRATGNLHRKRLDQIIAAVRQEARDERDQTVLDVFEQREKRVAKQASDDDYGLLMHEHFELLTDLGYKRIGDGWKKRGDDGTG